MVRKQVENQMRFVLAEIDRCELEIRAANSAQRKLQDLRRELERLAESYAKISGAEDAERKLLKTGWDPIGREGAG
ncbi:MAG: hypothetical protein AB1426_12630 [Bacillota bacterium]